MLYMYVHIGFLRVDVYQYRCIGAYVYICTWHTCVFVYMSICLYAYMSTCTYVYMYVRKGFMYYVTLLCTKRLQKLE